MHSFQSYTSTSKIIKSTTLEQSLLAPILEEKPTLISSTTEELEYLKSCYNTLKMSHAQILKDILPLLEEVTPEDKPPVDEALMRAEMTINQFSSINTITASQISKEEIEKVHKQLIDSQHKIDEVVNHLQQKNMPDDMTGMIDTNSHTSGFK